MYVCLFISFSDQGPASVVIAMFVRSMEHGVEGTVLAGARLIF